MHPKIEAFLNSNKSSKKLSFSWEYGLKAVPEELENCKEVEELDLSYTSITHIPDFVFELPKLKKLSYTGCDINIVPDAISLMAERLIELSISTNNMEKADTLYTLYNLKKLSIHGDFDSIPDEITKLANLEELTIINIELKKLTKEFGLLKRLKKVSLVGEIGLEHEPKLNMEMFFSSMAECKSLTSLTIDSYRLHSIPTQVSRLTGLQLLCLRNNLLEEIPEELYDLSELRELDLSINKIKSINTNIAKLLNLKSLNLSSNWENRIELKDLFSVIERLTNIEVLNFASCQSIREIPLGVSKLQKLKSVDFDNNLISQLPDFLLTMHNLKKLRISSNNIPQAQIAKLKEELMDVNVIG